MSFKKNFISISLSVSVLAGSISAYANDNICSKAFPAENATANQVTKAFTVRAHLQKNNLLKTEKEIEALTLEDKQIYLSLLDLDYNKAQEIMQLFATLPILTSPAVQRMFRDEQAGKALKVFLAESRSTEREKFSYRLANAISYVLGASEFDFVRTEKFEKLDSAEKVQAYNSHVATLETYGVPVTMATEVAQFFSSIRNASSEFKFIKALVYKNFDRIGHSAQLLTSASIKSIDITQKIATPTIPSALAFLGMSFFGIDVGPTILIPGTTYFFGVFVTWLVKPEDFNPTASKLSLTHWIQKAKIKIAAKKNQQEVRRDLIRLSGLDSKAIKALPTVEQLKKNPKSSTSMALMPALQNKNILAYPDVDLNRLENALESKISLEELNNLQPSFTELALLAKNPFVLLSYAIELAPFQNLIIGREEVLDQNFKEISERMSVWQNKRSAAKTQKEKSWIIDEKTNLIQLLGIIAKDNASSWEYLAALKDAIQRHDTYLIDVIRLHAGENQKAIDANHETFNLSLFQIDLQIKSLQERAEILLKLMSNLKI